MRGKSESPKTKRLRGRRLQARRAQMLEAEPLCRPCLKLGRVSIAVELDHITPLYKGGPEHPDNLQPICDDCHKAKTRADMGRQEIGEDGWPLDSPSGE